MLAMPQPKHPLSFLDAGTLAWLVLMLATGIGWWFGHAAQSSADNIRVATLGVLGTAFAKIWIVGFQFMELRGAPRALRYAFDAWTLGICTVLVAICIG